MKKIISSILLTVSFLLSFASCGKAPVEEEPSEYYTATFFAMDTEVTVRLAREKYEEGEYFKDNELSDIVKKCADIAKEKEALLSAADETSVLSELNTETDYFLSVDPELMAVIERSSELSEGTDGAFDITIGSVTKLWNITGESPAVPSDEEISEALSHVGSDKIVTDGSSLRKTDRLTRLDLGAIGKGYTLGKTIEYLNSTDVKYGIVSFGGNVGVFGMKNDGAKFKVAIKDAIDTGSYAGYVFINNQYVSVSGDYERYFTADGKKYSHIFDPSTGRPAETDITGVAVICKDPSLADALSTAVYVKGTDAALEFYKSGKYDFEALIQKKDGSVVLTDDLAEKYGYEEYVEPETETAE